MHGQSGPVLLDADDDQPTRVPWFGLSGTASREGRTRFTRSRAHPITPLPSIRHSYPKPAQTTSRKIPAPLPAPAHPAAT